MSRGRALLYAVVALVVGGVAYAVAVGSRLGQRAEASVLQASEFTFDPPAPLNLVSIASVAVTLVILSLLAWRGYGFVRAVLILVFSVAAIAASQLLKDEVLTRPGLFELDASNTFPSGHMTVFAVCTAALIWCVPPALRGIAAVAGAVLLGSVAWQLLEYGWHRPSDVLGGLALGVLAFALAAVIRPGGARARRPVSAPALSMNKVLGVMLTITGWCLIAGGVLLAFIANSFGSDALMLAAGETALIGASAITARMLTRLAE